MHENVTIPPERLMEAVDAIYFAAREAGSGAMDSLPSSLMGSADQPQVFCDFSYTEIREAERFLVRCGFLRIYGRSGPQS